MLMETWKCKARTILLVCLLLEGLLPVPVASENEKQLKRVSFSNRTATDFLKVLHNSRNFTSSQDQDKSFSVPVTRTSSLKGSPVTKYHLNKVLLESIQSLDVNMGKLVSHMEVLIKNIEKVIENAERNQSRNERMDQAVEHENLVEWCILIFCIIIGILALLAPN